MWLSDYEEDEAGWFEWILFVIKILFVVHFVVLWRAWKKLQKEQTAHKTEPNRWTVPTREELIAMSTRGDPLSDAVVSTLDTHPMREDYLRTLREVAAQKDVQDSEVYRRFLEQTERVPEWVDRNKIRKAQRLYTRLGSVTLFAGLAAIVESYCYTPGVRVLTSTGRLTHPRDINRRLVETLQFVVDIMLEGPFPGQTGFESACRVRLLHSYVRKYVLKKGEWNVEELGYPANQEDMLHTLVLFSHSTLRNLEQLGCVISDNEKEAYSHLWRYVGYVMGVEDNLFPPTYAQEVQLYHVINEHQRHPDETSRKVVHANIQALAGQPPFFLSAEFLYASLRYMLQQEQGLVDSVGVPQAKNLHLNILLLTEVIIKWLTILQWGVPGLTSAACVVNEWLIRLRLQKEKCLKDRKEIFVFSTHNDQTTKDK